MIDNCLTWESHISILQKKISRAIGLLKYARNFVQICTLINLYGSIIEPHFSYCCSVWGSCGALKLDMLQKLQSKAARIVTNSPFDASAAPLLQRLGWPSVQKMISKETGSMVYKSLNFLAPRYLSDLFVRFSGVHPRELRNSKTDLAIPMLRTFDMARNPSRIVGSVSGTVSISTLKWLPQSMPSGPNSRKNNPFLYIHL